MDGRIAHLHVIHRSPGGAALRGNTGARLEDISQRYLPDAWEDALERILPDDQTVYVLRHVGVALTLRLSDDRLDAQIADSLARRLTTSTAQSIVRSADDNLKTFANLAEYTASFVDALLRGQAWAQWYFYPFFRLQTWSVDEAIHEVLLEQRERLPQILAALTPLGTFDLLLQRLAPEIVRDLWQQGLEHAHAAAHREALRALVVHLFGVIDTLDLWAQPRPEPGQAVDDYLAQNDDLIDWRDHGALAHTLGALFHSLVASGYLRRLSAAAARAIEPRLTQALSAIAYVDTAALKAAMLNSLTLERPHSLQPVPERQRLLLDDLIALLREESARLDQTAGSAANALRLYTLLIAKQPRWTGDPLASDLLERLVHALAALMRGDLSAEALAALRRGDQQGALAALPSDQSLRWLASLGAHAADIIDIVTGGETPYVTPGNAVQTEYAGVFLLARALLDLRLAGLVEELQYPPRLADLLAMLGLHWAGSAALKADRLDPGLMIFAGIESAATLDDLSAAWIDTAADDRERFWTALLRRLVEHRLVSGTDLRLLTVPLDESRQALVAQDVETGLAALTHVTAADMPDATDSALQRWQPQWGELTGQPLRIADDAADADRAADRLPLLPTRTLVDVETDLTLALTADAVLRLWARWLRQFQQSSSAYLLEQFIHRTGSVTVSDRQILVEMAARPLDVVLELAGYLAPLEHMPWLGQRSVYFRIQRG